MGLGDGDGVAQLPVPAGISFAGHAGEGQVAGGRRVGVTYNTTVGSLKKHFIFQQLSSYPPPHFLKNVTLSCPTGGSAPRAACHWLTPNFYWLTQLSAVHSPISLGQYTALAQQAFLRGSNTFALIFRTDKLKCEHPSSMPPAAAPSAGHPLHAAECVYSLTLHTVQDLSLPCNYLYTQLLLLGNSLPTF